MSKFGKYAVLDEVVHHFDKEPEWYWKIKPPTSKDELAMQKFMVSARIEMGPDGVRREYPPTTMEIAIHEIALSFGGTNIPATDLPVSEGGEPIAKVGDPIEAIELILGAMPPEMIYEIWSAIGEAVPGWGSIRPKAQTSSPA